MTSQESSASLVLRQRCGVVVVFCGTWKGGEELSGKQSGVSCLFSKAFGPGAIKDRFSEASLSRKDLVCTRLSPGWGQI